MQGVKKNSRTEKAVKYAGEPDKELAGRYDKLTEECETETRYTVSRLEYIRLKLQRGDKKRIAGRLNVHPEWVSQVIRGKGVSEPVLQEAERIIRERKK